MSELRESDYQAAIDREMAKPDAVQRDQGLIAWAQSNIDDLKNPAAKIARDAYTAHQQANGKPTEASPLPAMDAYLLKCINRCRDKGGQMTVADMKRMGR